MTERTNCPSLSSEHTTENGIRRDFRLFITTESGGGRLIPGNLELPLMFDTYSPFLLPVLQLTVEARYSEII